MFKARHLVAACALTLALAPVQAINIEFDYSFDDGPVQLTPGQRSVLDFVAAEFGSRLTDTLNAANYPRISFFDPGADATGSGSSATQPGASLLNQDIAQDTLRIYAGAAELNAYGSGALGVGGIGGGTFRDRGQSGVGTTDVAPWGGSISFDVTSNWYVDPDPATTEAFSGFDFYSVAVHELAHVLGVGTTGSWFSMIDGANGFVGSNAVAAYSAATGQPETAVPTAPGNGHWANGTQSFLDGVLREAALDPSIGFGQRKPLTDLDWAALDDIGWEVAVTAVPEPETYAMMLAGLGLLGFAALRRQRGL